MNSHESHSHSFNVTICEEFSEHWKWSEMKLQNYLLVYNVLLLCAIIFLNAFLLYSLKRTKQIFRRSNLIIFSLCVSDLALGFLVQPLHLYRIYKDSCLLSKINYGLSVLLTNNTFLSVYFLAVFRYLSIKGSLKGRKVPRKWILIMIGVSWFLSAMVAVLHTFFLTKLAYFSLVTVVYAISVVSFVYFYSSLVNIARKSQRAVQSDAARMARGRRKTMKVGRTVIALFVAMFVCYTPMIVIGDYRAIMNRKTITHDHAVEMMTVFYWSLSLVYTNSAINALLVLYRNDKIWILFKESFFF